ncbi:MAG: hypothetical protein FWE03_05315 [Firmicutes bacterium]|nr:hypothetical protein [Bacillota bacterium]
MKNRAASITLEFLLAGIFVGLFAAILFLFNDGALVFFPFFGLFKGIMIGSLIKKGG